MPSPVLPSQFCNAVPAANADLCSRFTKFLSIAQLLCDFFSWFLTTNGAISETVKAEIALFVQPTGVVVWSAASSMGTGWLLADGSEVSRTTYANLFVAIGTRYGDGDGSTTFNLPDARSRSPIGAGSGSLGGALTFRDVNAPYVGEENHTQTISEMPAHHHSWDGPTSRLIDKGDGVKELWRGTVATDTTDVGSGTPFNVVHPAIVLFAFIKT